MRDSNTSLTICEVLRCINDRLQGPEHANNRDLLALAETMAKRMSRKLLEYSKENNEEWWAENVEYENTVNRMLNTHLVGSPERGRQLLEKR